MANLEIIALTLEDAIAAYQGGADSLELCVDLAQDGLTPPLDMVKAIRDAVPIELHVILRPHAFSFKYNEQDCDHILTTLKHLIPIGVTGVVCGALKNNQQLDEKLMRNIAKNKGDLILTMHRALDISANPTSTLHDLKGIAERVLCSGGARNVWEGREQLGQWVHFFPQFRFVAAGGVRLDNIKEIASITQAHEIHIGSGVRLQGIVNTERVRQAKELLS
jgi:copper homeostasis protein